MTATIRHTNDLTPTDDGENTVVNLQGVITEIGPKAKLAAFGMKWGYKAQLPPTASKHDEVRYLDIHDDDELDEDQLRSRIEQASNLPGEVI